MASLSSIPQRRAATVAASAAGRPSSLSRHSLSLVSSVSLQQPQQRNYWFYHHRRIAFYRQKSQEESSEESSNAGKGSYPGTYSSGGSWWGWGSRGELWRSKGWAFVRRLSSAGRTGWGDNEQWRPPTSSSQKSNNEPEYDIDPITNRKVYRSVINPPAYQPPEQPQPGTISLPDFKSLQFSSKLLSWQLKERQKLVEQLKKEIEEREAEHQKRQRKDHEEVVKQEKKRREREEKEAKELEKLLEMERKQGPVLEWHQLREQERQEQYSQNIMDDNKPIPHPIPVLHPYTQVPLYERINVDVQQIAGRGKKKGVVDRDDIAHKEQQAQPGKDGVNEVEATLVAGEAVEGVVKEMRGKPIPAGVEPLKGEGLAVTQASESPIEPLPDAEKVQSAEGGVGEAEPVPIREHAVNDAPILVEPTKGNKRHALEPTGSEDVGKQSDLPPLPTPTIPSSAPRGPPFGEPPIAVAEPNLAPKTVPTTPETFTVELSEIKDTLSQVTNVVTKLDSTMDYELNSILIQLRLWRRELERLSSTSGIVPAGHQKLFIKDTKEVPESQKNTDNVPMEYKILTLSPTPPYHLLTTDLTVANTNTWTTERNNISEFLPNLKEPYLFLQHLPNLTSEGWELVSGGAEMLMFIRKPRQIPSPVNTAGSTEPTSTDVNPPTSEPTTVFESSSTGFSSSPNGTGILKPDKHLMYDYNDDGHLHFYGHGLGGIAGDGVSFSSVGVRVNPIDMTTYDNDIYANPSATDDGKPSPVTPSVEDEHEERTRWDEKRSSAVKSMREGLGLASGEENPAPAPPSTAVIAADKILTEPNTSAAELTNVVENTQTKADQTEAEGEAQVLVEVKTADNTIHGQAPPGESIAREETSALGTTASAEEQGSSKKKGGGGAFFRRLGWTIVAIGAGTVLVKEVGYWYEDAEEKGVDTGRAGFSSTSGSDVAIPETSWGAVRPGQRYIWSERDRVGQVGTPTNRMERWGRREAKAWGEDRV